MMLGSDSADAELGRGAEGGDGGSVSSPPKNSTPREDQQEAPYNHPCLAFLNSTSSKDRCWHVQRSLTHGFGLYANRLIVPHTVLFELPITHIISYERVCATALSCCILKANIMISPAELTWLNMIVWRRGSVSADHQEHTYLNALDAVAPGLSTWSKELQDLLIGTNIHETDTVSATAVVDKVMDLLERLRIIIQVDTADDKVPVTNVDCDNAAAVKQLLLATNGNSIFTRTAIQWARGHFLSRRFLNTMFSSPNSDHAQQHVGGNDGTATSCFIPLLDLLNHSSNKRNTCKVEQVERENDGIVVMQVTSGETPVLSGSELSYCYGENLSNEVLLQAYGFCLDNNPADTVAVRIVSNTASTADYVGVIGRGGVSAIPAALWKAIAAQGKDDSSLEVEIGSGDLELLVHYFDNMLQALLAMDVACDEMKKKNETGGRADAEQRRYIHLYKDGQREILEELVRDLTLMQRGSEVEARP